MVWLFTVISYCLQEAGSWPLGKINMVDAGNPLMSGTITVHQAILTIRQVADKIDKTGLGNVDPDLTFGG